MDGVGVDPSGPDPETLDVVAEAIAAGASRADAGALVNRSDRTIRRWFADTDLDQRVAGCRHAMLDETAGGLARVAPLALQVATDVMLESEAELQLRAALAILDRALKFHAASDVGRSVRELTARIVELERHGEAS